VAAFAAGWFVLGIALVSPVHRLGSTLFSAHMVQHELLMVVAAPLLVLGRPLIPFIWALPLSWRRAVGGWATFGPVQRVWVLISLPLVAWGLHAVAIWAWHAPGLFQATLRSESVHTAQHLSFLLTALLFWWALLRGREGRPARLAGVLYLFTTAVHTNLLGALLAFSNRVWYPIYDAGTAPWGLTPLEDQQLAGLIMWVPAGVAYLVAALALAASWLREPARRPSLGQGAGLTLVPLLAAVVSLAACQKGSALSAKDAARATGGDPKRGAEAIRNWGCAACHTIPGIEGPKANVGPPLAGLSSRGYIAGVLPNTGDNLARWIQHPRQIDSLTAMPELGVPDLIARDMAAYLYTRK
jgi:cytochrome c oxidase assembly factor CtaG/cytochrome c2